MCRMFALWSSFAAVAVGIASASATAAEASMAMERKSRVTRGTSRGRITRDSGQDSGQARHTLTNPGETGLSRCPSVGPFGSVQAFDDGGVGHAAALAHRLQAVAAAA